MPRGGCPTTGRRSASSGSGPTWAPWSGNVTSPQNHRGPRDRPALRAGLRVTDELELADGRHRRDLVAHDLIQLRLRLAGRDLLQFAQCVLEVAALALPHSAL